MEGRAPCVPGTRCEWRVGVGVPKHCEFEPAGRLPCPSPRLAGRWEALGCCGSNKRHNGARPPMSGATPERDERTRGMVGSGAALEPEADMSPQEYFVDSLAHLASLVIQERHVVRGTRDEYLLPRELLLNFDDSYRPFRDSAWFLDLGPSVCRIIRELDSALEDGFDTLGGYTHETAHQLIHDDPSWNRIRQLAGKALTAMGFDLERWEREYE
jgi:hypothetical protein